MEKNSLEITEAWLLNYMKAFGLIAKGVTVENHTKIRSATSAIIMAWNTLRDFYNRTTMHNRVSMTRRLHEFKMESTLTKVKPLYNFKELIVGLQTFEKPLDEPHQLVILLSSQSTYELISNIVEKSKDDTLIEVMEKLLKQHKRPEKTEGTERALKAATNDGEVKNVKSFKGGKGGCPNTNVSNNEDAVFAVRKSMSPGWPIDSGATAHMKPLRSDEFEYKILDSSIEVTVADCKKIRVVV
ncbi:hypothetical protein PF001_g24810 [Phytophthora fragariae]|uniref:Uncharacterized protein n=3 Tax=Phytophthora TaxID=4783 RepID=A0A6A3E253_9STRA|nr:hypothetical protein PF009_g24016 [Phytophthora fragariae]KAE9100190.1 hypothetical protein PF006_g22956 [Phytophthora fragariae]KAE9279236.1 hypothetical protein PF001_g24810 [Phytophthora fragariae]